MTRNIIHWLKKLVLFVLIVVMTTPTAVAAAEIFDEGARWANLPVIEPLDVDLSRFPELAEALAMLEGRDFYTLTAEEPAVAATSVYTVRNELSELEPEVLEEILRNLTEYQT